MSSRLVFAGLLFALVAGSASAEMRHKSLDGRSPATTGSLGGAVARGSVEEASRSATDVFGFFQRPGRSTFNPTTARARHYER